jgi:hypothetical protein
MEFSVANVRQVEEYAHSLAILAHTASPPLVQLQNLTFNECLRIYHANTYLISYFQLADIDPSYI